MDQCGLSDVCVKFDSGVLGFALDERVCGDSELCDECIRKKTHGVVARGRCVRVRFVRKIDAERRGEEEREEERRKERTTEKIAKAPKLSRNMVVGFSDTKVQKQTLQNIHFMCVEGKKERA